MLTLLVPILINYLLEGDQLQNASKYQITLHQQSFQWLNKIGPKYPQVFYILYKRYCMYCIVRNIYKNVLKKLFLPFCFI